ncbi:polycomb group protein Psc-like [Anthonomus grandis grandis]|uniref:polycomb group protein Psc-like n=1 Tax=Anthonomus grandis grandis TaxID=2921223 RepID=UPI002165EF19|nr:polycomb group protein Psc-like [Anthonomus grandis grandis]
MEKKAVKTMSNRAPKKPVSDLNECITCKLCNGYFIDATTIIECLHTFCRSCIVRYLKSNKYCPICDVQVHKTKPLLNIRQDRTIQSLVYKLVPRLHQNESKRRRVFYQLNPAANPLPFELEGKSPYEHILAPDEVIDLTLSYIGAPGSPRYLRCPSAVSIGHLIRLIQAKYELTDRHRVDLFYNNALLDYTLTLMDVAYIYSWKKIEPLSLTYKIYERAKKPKLEPPENSQNTSNPQLNNNNNNWKEVQLRISENGEMSITGIQDSGMLDLLESTENFQSEIVINESKAGETCPKLEEVDSKNDKPDVAPTKVVISQPEEPPVTISPIQPPKTVANSKLLNSGIRIVINNAKSASEAKKAQPLPPTTTTSITISSITTTLATVSTSIPKLIEVSSTEAPTVAKVTTKMPKLIEVSENLNLNSELSVIPRNLVERSGFEGCVSLSSCGTTTVFSTINKSMCSTKSDDTRVAPVEKITPPTPILKRKNEEPSQEVPTKQPKPTILNHSIGLMNLNNTLKKSVNKLNKNGERKIAELTEKTPVSSQNLTVSHAVLSQKPPVVMDNSKPIIINKSLGYLHQFSRGGSPKAFKTSNSVPCYMPKPSTNSTQKNGELSNEKLEVSVGNVTPKPHAHYTPIITPSQLPHHQNLNSLQLKTTAKEDTPKPSETSSSSEPLPSNLASSRPTTTSTVTTPASTSAAPLTASSSVSPAPPVKAKTGTPMGYKTLRDPPKSWNSQINSQIARVNQTVKAQQQLAAAQAHAAGMGGAQARFGGDLKSVRPAKFFKGRNMPRYLGNPASGVKPMYQVQPSPEKDKKQDPQAQTPKLEKCEIKKHSIVKIDPKTLKPISEKAPETSNLSNVSVSLVPSSQELRLNSTGDLKINTSSVSIFNPLKLQQNSPKNDRKSPKSPHSPKVKTSTTGSSSPAIITTTPANSPLTINTLSPKQQRDKTNLTFTPSNPFVPNLASPTLNPNSFLYPGAGGFPSYDPRFMAACHSLWYTQRMAAAAAAGLVAPPMSHAFGLNIGLNPPTTIGQQPHSPGVSPKQPTSAKATGQSSPRTSSNVTLTSRSTPSPANKKPKESQNKSLESALEKISSKAKEINANRPKEVVKNGSPLNHVVDKKPVTADGKLSALEKISKNKALEIVDRGKQKIEEKIGVTTREEPTRKEVEERLGSPPVKDDKVKEPSTTVPASKPLTEDPKPDPPSTKQEETKSKATPDPPEESPPAPPPPESKETNETPDKDASSLHQNSLKDETTNNEAQKKSDSDMSKSETSDKISVKETDTCTSEEKQSQITGAETSCSST